MSTPASKSVWSSKRRCRCKFAKAKLPIKILHGVVVSRSRYRYVLGFGRVPLHSDEVAKSAAIPAPVHRVDLERTLHEAAAPRTEYRGHYAARFTAHQCRCRHGQSCSVRRGLDGGKRAYPSNRG